VRQIFEETMAEFEETLAKMNRVVV
jgi:hypothetical protein